jgi:DNA-binding SARP family transcriptional activator/class 3 adenylate cyclase/DNA-binding transcriptional ArsR family regulator
MNDGSPPSKFKLSLFGRFELANEDGVVELPNRKLSALLAYLSCTGFRPQPREKLAHLLWGAHFETQARQSLRQAIFRLRRIVGQNALAGNDESVWLAPDLVNCDAVRFRALIAENSAASLAAATALYRGSFLADLNIGEDAWSDWRASERALLERLALDAMIRQGQQARAQGNEEAALKAGHRIIELNDLREDAHRLVLQALVAMGRKAEALRHYQDLATLLKRELGTNPDPITQSLVADLRDGATNGPRSETGVFSTLSGASRVVPEISTATVPDDPTGVAAPSRTVEQRQLTILACDLVLPVAGSVNSEPDDVYELIAAFQTLVIDLAGSAGGFVAHYQGHGVVVYFGYPVAGEHDGEQAIRAARAIVAAAARLKTVSGEALGASAGIATGQVVVGANVTGHRSQHHVAIGEPVAQAMSLQSSAGAGEVLLAEVTQRLVGHMFACEPLSAANAELPSRSIPAWRVLGERQGVSRFDARRDAPLSQFVGREDEMALLLRRWEQTRRGEGQVVLISGDAGIGKSRVAESVLARVGDQPHACFRYACRPDGENSSLHPFIAWLEQACGFALDERASDKLRKLETWLGRSVTELPRDVAVFADLLGIPLDGRYPELTATPQQKREMTLSALLGRLHNAASQRPIIVLFEDVHWIDPTSLDLLARVVSAAQRLPILVLVTSRSAFRPGWSDQAHVATLSLGRLSTGNSARIVRSVAGGRALPEPVIAQILARADGIPLFVEELTRALLESRLLHETDDGAVLDQPLSSRAIPPTLQAALVARLDRLGPAKDAVVIGAAIGREFSHALVSTLSAMPPRVLEAALARLVEAGLVERRGTGPEESYLFRHALVQDAAYGTMPKRQRRQLHARIAATMAEQSSPFHETQPEVIAHHFSEAGLANEAAGYWVKAARLAQARWANREAARFFVQAIGALATLPETQETLEQAIDLRFDLKATLIPLGQFEEIVSALRESEDLTRRLGDQHRQARFFFHMCQTLTMHGDPVTAADFGRQALLLAETLGDVPLQIAATLFLGTAYFAALEYHQVEPLFERALKLLEDVPAAERFGLAAYPAVIVRAFLARVYAEQGRFEEGIALGEAAIRIARAVDHPYSQAIACWCLADLRVIRGEFADAIPALDQTVAIAREFDLPFMAAAGSGALGYAHAMLGRPDQGVPMLEQALTTLGIVGHRFAQALLLVPLGEAHLLAGQDSEAAAYAERALATARANDQRRGEAAAIHLLARVLARSGSADRAEASLNDAIAIATEFGLNPLAARCHHDLAGLHRRAARSDRALRHLETAITMFREMGMHACLIQAELMAGSLKR